MDKKKIKQELQTLIEEGRDIHYAATLEYDKDYLKKTGLNELEQVAKDALKKIIHPTRTYHSWYDKSYEMVRILFPRKLEEFEEFYTGTHNRDTSKALTHMTAGITHYLQGHSIILNDKLEGFFYNFNIGLNQQRDILIAIRDNFDNPLFNIEKDARHDVYKSEIDIAKDIQEQGHLKIAGAVAGVIIEAHLKTVVAKRNITLKSKRSLSTYNDALKKEGAYPDSRWRQIQTCGDIRNNCIHSKDIDPDEIDTIILSAEQIIKKVS